MYDQKLLKQNYQRRATRICQVVEDRQEHVIISYDQDEAHGLKQPVDSVKPHGD